MSHARCMQYPLLSAVLALGLLSSTATASGQNTLNPEEKAAGWALLFDGKTTEGWRAVGKQDFPDKGWKVLDGLLLHEKGGGGGDIVTTKTFMNFELSFDWKIGEAGNSGVKYNLPDSTKSLGFEFQLLDDEKHPDGIRSGALHQTGSLYDLIERTQPKANPVGQWNQSSLLVHGNRVEHWINGSKVLEFEIGSEDLKTRIAKSKYKTVPRFGEKCASPILLQDHGDDVWFKNIKIRELPSAK